MPNWISNVRQFVDGVDTLSAASINPVIASLAQREQYLFDQLTSNDSQTVLLSLDQPISNALATNSVGTPVYFNTSLGQPVLEAAQGSFTTSITDGHLFPSPNSYVFGLIKQVYSGNDSNPIVYGDVYVRGLLNDTNINYTSLLDTTSAAEGTLAPGPLFLSSQEAGKLSIFPSGAAVFVGYYLGGSNFILAPNIDSLSQLYFNYRLYLYPVAAGTPTQNVDTTWTINSPSFASLGWITTTQANLQYGITPPTGAKFYYNLPTDAEITALLNASTITNEQAQDAILLKKALPAHPAAYTMLFVNGVLQTEYDTDHTSGSYIIDENGVWWTNNTTDYLPWGSGLVQQLLITKLNPNYAASVVTSLTPANQAIQVTDANGIASTTGDLEIALNLNLVPITNDAGTGAAVQSMAFDAVTGNVNVVIVPVINTLTAGAGLTLTNTNGAASIALSNYSLSGEVDDLEPQEANLVYKGLHSYLYLKRPQPNQTIGFIGKLFIPPSIPVNTNLTFSLIGFTDGGTVSGSATASFVFQYACSNNGSSISTALTSGTQYIPGVSFPAFTQATVTNNSAGSPAFVVPYSAFQANSYINFRIARTYDTAATYPNAIGIIGVTWAII